MAAGLQQLLEFQPVVSKDEKKDNMKKKPNLNCGYNCTQIISSKINMESDMWHIRSFRSSICDRLLKILKNKGNAERERERAFPSVIKKRIKSIPISDFKQTDRYWLGVQKERLTVEDKKQESSPLPQVWIRFNNGHFKSLINVLHVANHCSLWINQFICPKW